MKLRSSSLFSGSRRTNRPHKVMDRSPERNRKKKIPKERRKEKRNTPWGTIRISFCFLSLLFRKEKVENKNILFFNFLRTFLLFDKKEKENNRENLSCFQINRVSSFPSLPLFRVGCLPFRKQKVLSMAICSRETNHLFLLQ